MNIMLRSLFTLIFLASASALAQSTFKLTDTTFKLNSFNRDLPVLFDYDKASLRNECFPALDSLADFIIKNPKLVIEVSNHADLRGKSYGKNLTQDRADAVVAYLVAKGVPQQQLVAKGYGSAKPIVPAEKIDQLKSKEDIENAHAKNRRTEFTIVQIITP